MEKPESFTVPAALLQSLVQYLAGRPYAEVAGLIQAVNTQARPVEKPAGEPNG